MAHSIDKASFEALADRFKLTFHRQPKEFSIYELSPASFQNAPNGIVTAQVHFDIFNPSTGLFGIIGHTIWDWLIGHLFAHSATLDPGC
jgi:hypothetical protein